MQRQVEQGLLDPPELTDNLRLVADRRSKYADAARKVQQAAVKLSLFYRDADGNPLIPPPQALPGFPVPQEVDPEVLSFDSQRALQQRPEIETIRLLQRQLDVDYAQAHNEFRPAIDAVVGASQDLGVPTSKRDDKSQFQMDAAVLVDVPLQRRKARGKMQSIDAKRSQLNAKRRMVEDKIVAEVQGVYLGMSAAIEQARQAEQAVQYAEDVARRERRNFELGASDLLKVTLREQYAAESAEKAVDALLLYHESRADYRAALAEDRL
jgi:outer membrane protein TolC